MPWIEVSTMSLRHEFVQLAGQEGANVRALCRGFGISPKTGYKWLQRNAVEGSEGLLDRSRRPETSPGRTPAVMEHAVLTLRDQHPAWGGRKLHTRLLTLGHDGVPSPARSRRSCAATGGWTPPRAPSTAPGSASSIRSPMTSGRWISRAMWRSSTAVVTP